MYEGGRRAGEEGAGGSSRVEGEDDGGLKTGVAGGCADDRFPPRVRNTNSKSVHLCSMATRVKRNGNRNNGLCDVGKSNGVRKTAGETTRVVGFTSSPVTPKTTVCFRDGKTTAPSSSPRRPFGTRGITTPYGFFSRDRLRDDDDDDDTIHAYTGR